jgi:tetratricopeptide (TPR) repeat protein
VSRLATVAAALAFAATLAVLVLSGETGSPVSPAGAGAARGTSTDARIQRLLAVVRSRPRDAAAQTALADAYLQRTRELEDPADYERAGAALDRALALKPGDTGALTERAVLRAGRHQFAAALRDVQAVRAAAPELNKPFGILVDALVELGRYPAAERALQQMVDRKPGLDAYARVSYLRELHGDLDGAEQALRLAISAGGEVPQSTAYVRALLGDLDLVRGRSAAALREYRAALRLVPGHPKSLHGVARALIAQGRLTAGIRTLKALVARVPAADHYVDLGAAEVAIGRRAEGRRHFREAVAVARRGVVKIDAEVALVEADHGDRARAVRIARLAYRRAPSVRSADAVGWALTRAGHPRQALPWTRRALRLGTRDPNWLFHAGIAAARAGADRRAGRLLRRLLDQSPSFSPLGAREARRALARIATG